jgi:hypothetical protein
MLVHPIEIVLNQTVNPWVLDLMAEFLEEDDQLVENAEMVITDAWAIAREAHRDAVASHY